MIEGSTQKEGTFVNNMHVTNIGAPKYIKQILTDVKGEINSHGIIILGNFNIPLISMDRSFRKSKGNIPLK